MRSSRTLSILALVGLGACLTLARFGNEFAAASSAPSGIASATASLSADSRLSLMSEYHGANFTNEAASIGSVKDQSTGIKENIPGKYQARYEKWKKEFLATDTGRKEWDTYSQSSNFSLTITISSENAEGASTGKYVWDDSGRLIAATITLGSRIDAGYPNPIYYPVMNSLTLPESSSFRVEGETLAATKMAHEFGHVKRTAGFDASLYQLQSKLIPVYNKIFMSNGRDIRDPRLVDLVRQIGGTPVEIWEDREYWGETNAMLYIRDRFTEQSLRCSLFSRIKQSIDLYAKGYEERFVLVARSVPVSRNCAW
jgi:YD repeat-containing protein